jgi:hypothetical protein
MTVGSLREMALPTFYNPRSPNERLYAFILVFVTVLSRSLGKAASASIISSPPPEMDRA